ncbi:ParB/RepB/Spo0J family partition protein [bacterium]|nr:ParB/RepB/Spo0J family partition protein [bacterium]
MYEELPLDVLIPNPQNTNRMSRMFAKKLHHNIEQLGLYETITVRPHPSLNDRFEVLNGHERINALRNIGLDSVRCDIWNVDDSRAQLFLAILNKLRGSDVPELRMDLLYKLLEKQPKEDLAAHIPETASYLGKLEKLREEVEKEEEEKPREEIAVVILNFYLSSEDHFIVLKALDDITKRFNLADSSEALVMMATIYLKSTE